MGGGCSPPKVMETRRKFSGVWDTNKQKKGICESASTQDKKPPKVADSQTDNSQIGKSGTL
jgi:hypothetical protein